MIQLDAVQEILRRNVLVRGVDRVPKGHIRIETGLTYPEGASIDVFLVERDQEDQALYLSDFGQTVAWLLDMQIKPWLSKKRQSLLDDTLRLLGVRQNGAALEMPLHDLQEAPEKVLRLAQACLRVSDLTFTRRSTLQTSFIEEIEEVIVDAEVPYETNVELIGRYERPIRVDFLVSGTHVDSAILTLGSGNSSQAHALATEIFSRWYDLRDVRHEQRITIFDDSKDVYRDSDLRRLEDISELVALSDRRQIQELVVA